MARKKPDYAHINTPLLQEYCDKNGLKYAWKNQAQGHMIVQSVEFEAYVWVQRMRVMVRMRGGVPLSHPDTFSMSNAIFNESDFSKLVGKLKTPAKRKKKKGKRPPALIPHIEGGIVIVRIPQNATVDEATKAKTWAHNLAMKINRSHEKDHYYEKGDWK